jgi:hypothetical protein
MEALMLTLTADQRTQLLAELDFSDPLRPAVLVGPLSVTPALLALLSEMAGFEDSDQAGWQALFRQAATLAVFCADSSQEVPDDDPIRF